MYPAPPGHGALEVGLEDGRGGREADRGDPAREDHAPTIGLPPELHQSDVMTVRSGRPADKKGDPNLPSISLTGSLHKARNVPLQRTSHWSP